MTVKTVSRTPVPPRPRVTRPRAREGFTGPEAIRVGQVVMDRDKEMVTRVDEVDGRWVELSRPTGLSWRVNWLRLRPASEREHQQLHALGKLHQQQLRGKA
ncbi:hypothetical protein OG909_18285 [Streptomyces sp. NBC_01754]|uniref:hypothetical protein n=1 Tax=Streptomyces sp. NBC_01754 TaxID=2975930 RepID=UPI002DDC69AE|nr:hypothetical protein [Streptomyces sp. NBC_01754]WSC94062.1 hypothetical protein OG909_18285 [Streptomyces sp. NBC_01754]